MPRLDNITISLAELEQISNSVSAKGYSGEKITIVADEEVITIRDGEGFKIDQWIRETKQAS